MKFDSTLYQKAVMFAANAHGNQKYPGSEVAYIVHPVQVAAEVWAVWGDEPTFDLNEALTMALLHDVIEDTSVSYALVLQNFGERVARGVLALSKNEELPRDECMPDSLRRIAAFGKEAAVVKLCDRICNLSHPPYYWTLGKIQSYAAEAEVIYTVLAQFQVEASRRLLARIESYRRNYCRV